MNGENANALKAAQDAEVGSASSADDVSNQQAINLRKSTTFQQIRVYSLSILIFYLKNV